MALKRAWGVEGSCDGCFRFCPDLLIRYFHLQSPLLALSSTALPLHSCLLSLPTAFLSFHSCFPWAKLRLMLLPIILISMQGKLDPDPSFLEMRISTHSFPKEVYSEPVCCWMEHSSSNPCLWLPLCLCDLSDLGLPESSFLLAARWPNNNSPASSVRLCKTHIGCQPKGRSVPGFGHGEISSMPVCSCFQTGGLWYNPPPPISVLKMELSCQLSASFSAHTMVGGVSQEGEIVLSGTTPTLALIYLYPSSFWLCHIIIRKANLLGGVCNSK